MLEVEHKHNFLKKTHRINDKSVKERVKNQIKKILENQDTQPTAIVDAPQFRACPIIS